jgi:hypothetical protein
VNLECTHRGIWASVSLVDAAEKQIAFMLVTFQLVLANISNGLTPISIKDSVPVIDEN